jgi:hypothetical protein
MSHSLPRQLGRRGGVQGLDTQLRKPLNAQESRGGLLLLVSLNAFPFQGRYPILVHKQVRHVYPTIVPLQLDQVDLISLNPLKSFMRSRSG